MDAERIAAIRARVEAAQAGPWNADDGMLTAGTNVYAVDYILSCCNIDDRTLEFIAASRQDVPDLLAALDAARADVARLREALVHRCTVEKVEPACDACKGIIAALAATEPQP